MCITSSVGKFIRPQLIVSGQQKGKEKKNHTGNFRMKISSTTNALCYGKSSIEDVFKSLSFPPRAGEHWAGKLGHPTGLWDNTRLATRRLLRSSQLSCHLTESSTGLDGQHKGSVSTLLIASRSHKKQFAANTAANLEGKRSFHRGDQKCRLLLYFCAGSRHFVLTARTLIKSGSWKDVVKLQKPTIWPVSYTVGT